jgi:hypothetical protein
MWEVRSEKHASARTRTIDALLGAFSSEVDTASREENASNKKLESRSASIGTEKAIENSDRPENTLDRQLFRAWPGERARTKVLRLTNTMLR